MIGRANRFHGHNSLNAVYRHGQTVRGEGVSLRFAPTTRPDYRLAVVVSKKVSKLAVKRNRIRRRIYESVRLTKKSVNIAWPFDLVITVFDDRMVSMPAADLHAEITKLLQKSKVL